MHPDHDLEQFYTRSHLPGVPRPFHQLAPDERIDWAKRMEKAQFEAWAQLHHYDLTRCSHEPYAAYRSDLTNAALAGWRGANGEAVQPDHYQQLLGVAYVVLGCLAANGVDIPVRFLDAFSDPDSVENPLELLPCDFSPARAVRAAVGAQPDDAFRQRVERLLVELHNEDRLSEGQCAKVLDIDRISWRKIADEAALERPTTAQTSERMVAACCGRSECGGECGNEWRGMEPAQIDERTKPWWHALAAAADAVEKSADVWQGFGIQDAKVCVDAYLNASRAAETQAAPKENPC